LVITYRELRLLEMEILRALNKSGQRVIDVNSILWIEIDKFYGIEYEEFPARIAELAMWLIDHQMNMKVSIEFGQYFVRLPLKNSAKIVHGNALRTDWESVVSKTELSYIIGNPPFIGSRMMSKEQKNNLNNVFENIKNVGDLDYVTGWYIKAAKYIQHTKIKVAFVGTNSVVQGLQTSLLWKQMAKYDIKIHFAHRTFRWSNEAKGNAAVYCVIVGFANFDTNNKTIYEYEDIKGKAHEIKAKNISAYLTDTKDVFIERRQKALCNVPEMCFGNMPADGGEFLFTTEEKKEFLKKEPHAKKYFKPFVSAYEFLNNKERWCLWLEDIKPNELRNLKLILKRVQNVKAIREKSARPQLANIPHLFAQITQPKTNYVLIPRVSSERRNYIPMGSFNKNSIVSDTCLSIPDATLYHFGILMSKMHMAWVQAVCGRLESRYRYSKDIVYNNFPWAEEPTSKQIKAIEKAAQKILDVRKQFPDSSLADLYDPLTMPPALLKVHNALDKVVDLAYRPQPFTNEANRMEFLFGLYEKYTKDLFTKVKPKKKRKNEIK
jgi:hypothetical protein